MGELIPKIKIMNIFIARLIVSPAIKLLITYPIKTIAPDQTIAEKIVANKLIINRYLLEL
jgi:hypothetical protein